MVKWGKNHLCFFWFAVFYPLFCATFYNLDLMQYLKDIEPAEVWQYFEEICRIPRLSKKESKITEYLLSFAGKHRLEAKQDDTGNVLIRKKASPGKEKLPPVVLQSHVDMVGEKEMDVEHDFEKDPIVPTIKGDHVTARGTTLGADDGIGMAAQLAILASREIEHGPLECLFTVDEESGLTGAARMEGNFFEGRILINLDSEDEGELFIGCAGGVDTIGTFRYKSKKTGQKSEAYLVRVNGLKGGHSGDEIHKDHGNAIKILNRFLWNATREFKLQISSFNGGNLRNAIPRESEARIVIPAKHRENFEGFFRIFSNTIAGELGKPEPDLFLDLQRTGEPPAVMSRKQQRKLLNTLYACPHGVISWAREMDDLVETSANLASIQFTGDNHISVVTSQRSSLESAKKDISDRLISIFQNGGFKAKRSGGYPGWTPNRKSAILKATEKTYRELFRKKPVVRAVHAGLECGLFLEKYPGLDMISFGPTIKGAHTPKERISIESTVRFWKLLLRVIRNVPG